MTGGRATTARSSRSDCRPGTHVDGPLTSKRRLRRSPYYRTINQSHRQLNAFIFCPHRFLPQPQIPERTCSAALRCMYRATCDARCFLHRILGSLPIACGRCWPARRYILVNLNNIAFWNPTKLGRRPIKGSAASR